MKLATYLKKVPFPHTKGFSLVETLVAVTLLLTAIAGVMNMAQGGLQSALEARHQLVALYLAQEASEYMRNVRDTNLMGEYEWDRYFYKCRPSYAPYGCYIDAMYPPGPPLYWGMRNCSSATVCRVMNFDSQSGKYSYDNSWPVSQYDRRVFLTPVRTDASGVTEEYLVEVTVSWTGRKGTRSVKYVSGLHNWR
jgi:hypothetical protein